MPSEKPLKKLEDKLSKGYCPHCERTYRVPKKKSQKHKTQYYCPHCHKLVNEGGDEER